jgi:hypothetical protein
MKTNIYFWSFIAQFFLKSEMFQLKFVERIKTHVLFSIIFFSKIVPFMRQCKKHLKQKRPEMKIWILRIACWILKVKNTHSEYLIRIALPLQQWSHEAPQYCVMRTFPALLSPRFTRNYPHSNIPNVGLLAIQVSRRIPAFPRHSFK